MSSSLRKISRLLWLSVILISFLVGKTNAQITPEFFDYSFNHLKWYSIESEHFMIHFQEGNSQSAQILSQVVEDVYEPITTFYKHEPDTKVNVILRDRQDYANGAAYFFDNKIEIWVPALDTPLRGTRDWFRNVMTHEFTHVIQIQKSMKRKRQMPAWYLQWLSYENVRRPDVLYGFPTAIVTMPIASINMPAWFAEGTAQFQRTGLHYDIWDAHRDMILRTRVLSNTQLSLTKMGDFGGKTSLESETLYNQGFAFCIYMARRFGEEILVDITDNLSKSGVIRVEKAIEMATGIPGQELFDQFIADRKEFYDAATTGMQMTDVDTVEALGFANYHPTFTQDGEKLAYISNRFMDYNYLALYIKDVDSLANPMYFVEKGIEETKGVFGQAEHIGFSCHNHEAHDGPAITSIADGFSFSPDGRYVAYSMNKLNKYGEYYKDVFIYDIIERKRTGILKSPDVQEITKSARIHSPSFSPDGKKLVAVQMKDNTQNLVIINIADSSVSKLTNFTKNQQIYRPIWSKDQKSILYSKNISHPRKIYAYDLTTDKEHLLIGTDALDYRDVSLDPANDFIYYAANKTGIFNIYRAPYDAKHFTVDESKEEQLTNVVGGAFMPAVSKKGLFAWSEYQKDGYKIMSADLEDLLAQSALYKNYHPVNTQKNFQVEIHEEQFEHFMDYKDREIEPYNAEQFAIADTGSFHYEVKQIDGRTEDRELRSYNNQFTDFSMYPVLRFDNYNKPKGANGSLLKAGNFGDLAYNLGRDIKFGTYFSSREVTESLNIFGGIMIAPASQEANSVGDFFKPNRLVSLDRDIFLTIEKRGLPFIKKRWSPTIQVNLFNIRRNVSDGLTISEHECTSCAPDTSMTDIAYNAWQADINFISKLNKWNLIQLGLSYSPYNVETESFYSREEKAVVSGSNSEYFKSTTLTAAYIYNLTLPSRNSDIAPIGFKGSLRYNYQPSKLLDNYKIENGSLIPIFETEKLSSFEMYTRYGFGLRPKLTGQLITRFYSFLNDPEDLFYTDYIGGITGLRSYPFFSVGGNTTAFGVFSLITPIKENMNLPLGRYRVDKVYMRFFAEAGNGWRSQLGNGNNLKTGIGAELRVAMVGQYLFPAKFFISGSYGLNDFNVRLRDEFINDNNNRNVNYGRELLIHFGFTFDFELN